MPKPALMAWVWHKNSLESKTRFVLLSNQLGIGAQPFRDDFNVSSLSGSDDRI